jgi:hypothetical protein
MNKGWSHFFYNQHNAVERLYLSGAGRRAGPVGIVVAFSLGSLPGLFRHHRLQSIDIMQAGRICNVYNVSSM